MEKRSRNPMEWLNLMVSEPYDLFHFLSFFSYFVLRSSVCLILSPSISHRLLHREIQAILALALLAAIKMVKDETWEAFIADMLFFAKLLLVAISLILDYHLAFWYILIFSVIYILTQQAAYQGLVFENAAEVTRFPEWDFEAISSHPPVTKRQLYKHFELDRLLLEYISGK